LLCNAGSRLTRKGRGMITIPVITERCAGIDVGKRGLAAAVAAGPADKEAEIRTRWFATTMPALRELHQWLREEGCTTVALESTGSWWISIKTELEDDLRITLVCPRKHHPKKGDKTDFRDAVELALHHRHGLLTGSFLPERGIVELRDLTRRRKKLLGNLSSEKNRIQKVLDTAGVKMGNVISDVFGVSGQEILQALLKNTPPEAGELADMAKKRLRNRIPELTEALQNHYLNDHHRWLIGQSIDHAQFLDLQVEAGEKRIDAQLEPYRRQYQLLQTIPGIKEHTAAAVLAEIGADMNQFATADKLCKWARICPGNNRSAGKKRHSHIQKGNKFLLAALVEAAWGASRKQGSVFRRKYRQFIRLGEQKATIAVCHALLRTIWSVLKNDRPYVEPDTAVLENLERQRQIRHHTRKLQEMGADKETIDKLTEKLLADPPEPPADTRPVSAEPPPEPPGDSPAQQRPPQEPEPKAHSAGRRPVARGVLGFRIRTAPLTKYSVEKDLSAGAPPRGRTKTKGKDKNKT
jgi:transposase